MDWTQDGKLEILRAYISAGLNYAQIAEKMKLTYDAIEHACRRYKLKADKPIMVSPTDQTKVSKQAIGDLARQLGEEVYDRFQTIKLDTPKPIKSEGKKEEMSILDLSDVHIGAYNEVYDSNSGKSIVTYNEKLFAEELDNLQNGIFKINKILQPSYKLRELTVFVLGDILTNDRIFDEQVFEIEKIVGLQLWDGVKYFIDFFNNLLNLYEKITVVCVVGNHGRSLPNSYEEPCQNNFEYHLYRIWQKQFENNPRIKIIVPDTKRYIHDIYGWKHLMEHGDSIQGMSEVAVVKQIKDLHLNVGGFDVVHLGHFHQIKEIEVGDKILVKQNGSWIRMENYAWKKFKTYTVPKQWFWGASQKRVNTWNYKINLSHKEH